VSQELTVPAGVFKHAPQYVKDFTEGRITRQEFEECRRDYWEARGYVVTAGGLERKELIDKGILVMLPNGNAAINSEDREVPTGKPGRYREVTVIDERYFDHLDDEEKRIDSAIRASTYADHVAEYYADEEEAW